MEMLNIENWKGDLKQINLLFKLHEYKIEEVKKKKTHTNENDYLFYMPTECITIKEFK